jgi:hypothetical protein
MTSAVRRDPRRSASSTGNFLEIESTRFFDGSLKGAAGRREGRKAYPEARWDRPLGNGLWVTAFG